MKRILLDGRKMIDRDVLHLYLKYHLNLPQYYGNNLDALYDILSTRDFKQEIELRNTSILFAYDQDYTEALIDVFEDAARVNPNLKFIKK